MKNKKGFTLIELLAVIVILAILLAIAVPKITQYIANSKKDSMVDTAKNLIRSVTTSITDEIYDAPIGNDDVTIVSLNLIHLEEGSQKSSFNAKWLSRYSYVAVINVGTDMNPDYKYFVALRDSKRYTISLKSYDKLTRNSIVRDNANGTIAAITTMCGSSDGEYKVIPSIAGLEEYQPTSGWNATIYSAESCK